ncbi:thymidylate synthase (FAD) [Candidatus Kaiserbacteria bacterium CG10_big_fil_rev_8_21_14_0_10_49_17]|uniref:Flavin-dependent thymidylate synthase n=1 Tax=Candidatus Kaiserbacteria bacterium CG10_big_fil_rev_8_21_14_0_10_49_17 TaxID=1974609 RepID=A0A2M6WDT5_9BACT|nr:MAG: thymidylate synthase (FAD) [Candidatus Kaiserbacteria bacterium CG10_big_fil_rev_8_21_14_0_10_49_17]
MTVSREQRAEMRAASEVSHTTKRPTVSALERILHSPIELLDHGLLRVIDYMGDDTSIVQAARVSYGIGTKNVRNDRGLIRYLMRHRHTTPFEMCEIKFHVKLPVFVARQWIRHRTANVNEYSARYSILDREFYIPKQEHLATQSKSNRQGRGVVLEGEEAERVLQILKDDAFTAYDHYVEMLNEDEDGEPLDPNRDGLARELARMNLPLNIYTQWYWKTDLHNLFHFLSLRADPHAQYEIRVYAEYMLEIVEKWVPIACEAFRDYRLGAVTFSSQVVEALRKSLDIGAFEAALDGLSEREVTEVLTILKTQ